MEVLGTKIAQTVRALRAEFQHVQLVARRSQVRSLSIGTSAASLEDSIDLTQYFVRRTGQNATGFHHFSYLDTDAFIEELRGAPTMAETASPGVRRLSLAKTSVRA